jgi:glycosyltransferase involved in cell wall biosynthesis
MRRWLIGRQFEQVEFLGMLPQTELPRHMSQSHVHVLASVEEGLAYVQAQAMACGCPLISTTNTGAEDLITDGREGFIVPIRDPSAIANKLQLLADDESLRAKMSTSAKDRVKKLSGWDTYGERFSHLLERLVHLSRCN